MEETPGLNQYDFANLKGSDEYALYFNLLSEIFGKLLKLYEAEEENGGGEEAKAVRHFLTRLLCNARMMRLKFAFSPSHKGLMIDMSQSGFPNREVIASLDLDLRVREERLIQLLPAPMLKQEIVNRMLKKHEDPKDLLWQLADRTYFEQIKAENLFLPFTPGELILRKKKKARGSEPRFRSYLYTWGCYDFSTNRPYIHVMEFDQDVDEEPLENNGGLFIQFLHVIKAEGSRTPDVGVLAFAIDNALEGIHPKNLKRLGIGPFHCPLLLQGRGCFESDLDATACTALAQFGTKPDDFILFFEEEVIFSKDQRVTSGLFRTKVREVFDISRIDVDPEAHKRHASMVSRSVLMPHSVRQSLSAEDERAFCFDRLKVFTYDEKGDVHGT